MDGILGIGSLCSVQFLLFLLFRREEMLWSHGYGAILSHVLILVDGCLDLLFRMIKLALCAFLTGLSKEEAITFVLVHFKRAIPCFIILKVSDALFKEALTILCASISLQTSLLTSPFQRLMLIMLEVGIVAESAYFYEIVWRVLLLSYLYLPQVSDLLDVVSGDLVYHLAGCQQIPTA